MEYKANRKKLKEETHEIAKRKISNFERSLKEYTDNLKKEIVDAESGTFEDRKKIAMQNFIFGMPYTSQLMDDVKFSNKEKEEEYKKVIIEMVHNNFKEIKNY